MRGLATHCRWCFVKSAKAVAPILCALAGAFSVPPAALTCAPKYFIGVKADLSSDKVNDFVNKFINLWLP